MRLRLLKPVLVVLTLIGCFSGNAAVQAADAHTATPTLAVAQQNEIKEKQLQLAETIIQQQRLQNQYDQLSKDQQRINQELNGLLVKAQDQVDKDKKVWQLNPRTLTFEPVTAAPPVEPAKK
jgi:hypothetical protein